MDEKLYVDHKSFFHYGVIVDFPYLLLYNYLNPRQKGDVMAVKTVISKKTPK